MRSGPRWGFLLAQVAALAGFAGGLCAQVSVQVKETPTGEPKVEAFRSWSAARAGAPVHGAALENQALLVVAQPGAPGAVVYHLGTGAPTRQAELALVSGGVSAPIGRVTVESAAEGEAVVKIVAGGAEAKLLLASGANHVKVLPGKGADALEVRTGARYAVLPDFFADDVVFDPLKLSAPKLTVPAENFLLQFADGGNAIVMCAWPGHLKLPAVKPPAAPAAPPAPAPAPKVGKEGAEPQVDLFFAGEARDRRVSAARIEFQGQPVSVGVLQGKGLWQDENISALEGYKPAAIAWKRPFEAKWRGDFIVADGRTMRDWPTRHQSFEFKSTADPKNDKWWERGDANAPQIWQESLTAFFVYPAVLKGDEVRLCPYVDKDERNKADRALREARKADTNAPAVPYSNVYERVIIYPLDRVAATPMTAYTLVDLMRETLGEGPCEYVLDLSGVKPRALGGDRPILSYATCGLWDQHIYPITREFKKKPDGTYEPLSEKDKAHLVQALEDMWYFVHAIHDRLREYKQWGAETDEFCKQQAAANPKLKPLADKVAVHLNKLNNDIKYHRFEGNGSEAYWKDRIPELVKMAREDNYAEIATVGQIRNLGNNQDERVSRCRQYVKGLRQEILLHDSSDPEVRQFAAELRDRCHQMLRNMHPKEGF